MVSEIEVTTANTVDGQNMNSKVSFKAFLMYTVLESSIECQNVMSLFLIALVSPTEISKLKTFLGTIPENLLSNKIWHLRE